MSDRLLLGRSLHVDNMRIVRSVAASFIRFFSGLKSRGSELNNFATSY